MVSPSHFTSGTHDTAVVIYLRGSEMPKSAVLPLGATDAESRAFLRYTGVAASVRQPATGSATVKAGPAQTVHFALAAARPGL